MVQLTCLLFPLLLLAATNIDIVDELHIKAINAHHNNDNSLALQLIDSAILQETGLPHLSSNLQNTRGVIMRALSDQTSSATSFTQSISLNPLNYNPCYNLANLFHYDVSNPQASLTHYFDALQIIESQFQSQPVDGHVLLLNDYSIALKKLGDDSAAAELLLRATTLNPTDLQSRGNLVIALKDTNRLGEAVHHSKIAIEIDPASSQVRHNYGLVLQQLGEHSEAVTQWQFAVQLDPLCHNSLASLGHEAGGVGNLTGAVHYYNLAYQACLATNQISELSSLQLQIATAVIPLIYKSTEEIAFVRKKYRDNLEKMLALNDLQIDSPETSIGSGSLGYYIIYQGFHDKYLRELLAKVYWKACPSLRGDYVAPLASNSDHKSKVKVKVKVKVGFHSSFFFHHSVGLLMQGVIAQIDRNQFDVFVFFQNAAVTNLQNDQISSNIRDTDSTIINLPDDLTSSRKTIASHNLDVMIWSEVGMDSTSYFLPFSKLAKKSALFWGHAVTSGIPTIDYFISSSLFEPSTPPPQARYTEKLYQMSSLTTYFNPPVSPRPNLTLSHFGLTFQGDNVNVYLCPQTLYKLHPDFDRLILGVLLNDPLGIVVFPAGQREEFTTQTMARLNTTTSLTSRIHFVPRMDFDEFISLAQLSNVVLDPFPVGGGRSSFEMFSVGTPIVMLYNRTSILQLTYGMYKTMGIMDAVTYSENDFINKAVAIGKDRSVERNLRERILQQNHLIYQSDLVIDEWNTFLNFMVAEEHDVELLLDQHFDNSIDKNDYADSAYALKLAHEHPQTHDTHQIVVKLKRFDDPIITAKNIALHIDAEYVKFRWLAAVLQHGVRRLEEKIVKRVTINKELDVVVHEGDDLALVATFYGLKYGLNSLGIAELLKRLVQLVPGHGDDLWIEKRRTHDHLMQKEVEAEAEAEAEAETPNSEGRCYLTVAITTCKRFFLFEQTINSLLLDSELLHSHICEIIVIDDSSSSEDKTRMQQSYPNLTFVFKPPDKRGHAVSMNMILELIETRYMLYLEDDFVFLQNNVVDVIGDGMAVLRQKSEKNGNHNIAQVLLNDQSSRACAYAEPDSAHLDPAERCKREKLGTAGWNRSAGGVLYVEHEFGTVYPSHAFSIWPGFSLNPGIWDLQRLEGCLGSDKFHFDSKDNRFEQSFSVLAMDSGCYFAHLPQTNVRHIGTEISSYVLNEDLRPWD